MRLEYLDRLGALAERDRARGGAEKGFAFTVAAAKYVATAMAYDDVPRVADLKIRASRQERVRQEVGAAPDAIVIDHGIFPPPRRGALRLAAEGFGRMDRSAPRARCSVAEGHRSRPPDPAEYDHRLSHARCGGEPRPAPPQYVAPRSRNALIERLG